MNRWTEEELTYLRKAVKEGETTGVIAKKLGRSKNAIGGMIFRLKHETSARERAAARVKIAKPAKQRFQKHRLAPVGHPFVRRLFEELNSQQCTLIVLAERSGLDKHTFVNWRHHTPKVSDLEAAFNVVGLTMKPRPVKETEI